MTKNPAAALSLSGEHPAIKQLCPENIWSISYFSEYILVQQGSLAGEFLSECHFIRKSSC
jgi:hypothetical protein